MRVVLVVVECWLTLDVLFVWAMFRLAGDERE